MDPLVDAGSSDAPLDWLAMKATPIGQLLPDSTLAARPETMTAYPNQAPSTKPWGTPDVGELASAPFDQESWDRWQARGRAADAAIARRLRTAALFAAAIGILGALI